jgi:tRNA(Arg) A34 adenosine deaminase TadA
MAQLKTDMGTDEVYMRAAIEQARIAKLNGEWPFGAVIVRNGEIIAQNRRRETETKNVLSHAELLCVGDACEALHTNNLSDCTIYCTNEPCLMCAAAIFQAKIGRVVIAISRADLPHLLRPRLLSIEDAAKDSGYPISIVRDILKAETLELFSDIRK